MSPLTGSQDRSVETVYGKAYYPWNEKRMIIKLYLFTLPESGNTVGGNYKQFSPRALPSLHSVWWTSLLNTQPVMWFRKHLQVHTSAQQTMQNVGFVTFLEVLANKAQVDHSRSSFWKHQFTRLKCWCVTNRFIHKNFLFWAEI